MPYHVMFFHREKIVEMSNYLTVFEQEHGPTNSQKTSINLTISRANKARDEGEWKCVVMDYFGNLNSVAENITFVSGPVAAIQDTVIIAHGKKQATFLIEFVEKAELFKIFSPKNEIIFNEIDVLNSSKYIIQMEEDRFKFKIKYPDIEDFGNYIILSTIKDQNFTTMLKLVVLGESKNFLTYTMKNTKLLVFSV